MGSVFRPDLSELDIKSIARESFGMDVSSVTPMGGYIDQNFRIDLPSGERYLIKVHSRNEPDAVLALQNEALTHLSAMQLDFATPAVIKSASGDSVVAIESSKSADRVRCLTYIDGQLLAERTPISRELLHSAGSTIAALDQSLASFNHPAASRPDMDWDLRNAQRISGYVHLMPNPAIRRLADYFFLQFETTVLPELNRLPLQICHNDGHRYSLLTDHAEQCSRIAGVIDFGDICLTHAVCHLAVCISDLIVGQDDLVAGAADIVAGYHQVRALSRDEISLIYHLVGTRLAIYAAMAGRALREDPTNAHPQAKLEDVGKLLRRLSATSPVAWRNALLAACQLAEPATQMEAHCDALVDQRHRFFSPSLYTHYAQPIVLEQSAFQYFYDQSGATYLDCVNNVCQWGHCHPSIVRAAQKQMATLNTNSRYVYEQMAAFAERLTDTMPNGLDTVFFVNSGSEANDLAARLARAYTGNNDFVVVDRAYHGNSSLSTDLSPNRIDRPGRPGLPNYVRKTECPDLYRGRFRDDDPNAAQHYINDLGAVIDDMVAAERSPAAFFAESLIGTGGQIVFPENYLASVYSKVRAAGGVCVADEVQVGFGRTGDHVWCFQSQGVTPDIVTMGKPIANGHPMAAVVTRREIAEAFDNGITYFNTFGGNPVSCAIGLACLNVLEQENLMANTKAMSSLLLKGLDELQSRHSLIGDIRGLGLYIGVELVTDRLARTPATSAAKLIVELMKTKGILVNTNGYDSNVIKIKPPMIIDAADIDQLLSAFESALCEVEESL